MAEYARHYRRRHALAQVISRRRVSEVPVGQVSIRAERTALEKVRARAPSYFSPFPRATPIICLARGVRRAAPAYD